MSLLNHVWTVKYRASWDSDDMHEHTEIVRSHLDDPTEVVRCAFREEFNGNDPLDIVDIKDVSVQLIEVLNDKGHDLKEEVHILEALGEVE